MALYGSVTYWDSRYKATKHLSPVEWYRNYSSLRHLLNPISFSITNAATGTTTTSATPPTTTNHHHPIKTIVKDSLSSNTASLNKGHVVSTKNNNHHHCPKNNIPMNTTNGSSSSSIALMTNGLSGSTNTTTTSPVTWAFPSREECRVLILGCGNSTFGEDMIRDGWTGPMVQIDYSKVVIDQMNSRYNDAFYEELWNNTKKNTTVVTTNHTVPNNHHNHNSNYNAKTGTKKSSTTTTTPSFTKMKFICADATNECVMMDLFPDSSSFDLIVCKGMFDAVLTTSSAFIQIRQLIRQCHRILAERHGIFFLVTNGTPDNRLEYLEHEQHHDLNYYWQGVGIHAMTSNPKHERRSMKKHQVLPTFSRTFFWFTPRKLDFGN